MSSIASRNGWLNWQLLSGALLWVCVYAVLLEAVFELSWLKAAFESFVINLHIAVFAFISFRVINYYQPGRDRFWFLVALAAAFGALVVIVYNFFMSVLCDQSHDAAMLEKLSLLHGEIAFLAHAGVIWYAMQRKDKKEHDAVQKRQDQTERLAREAELLKLRHQLQPHFLFNSLNSINALIATKPAEARSMVHQLSTFLRGTIKAEDQQANALAAELDYIQLYLDIEKVRFGHRLKTTIHASDESKKAMVPSLLLQPLMENAIKFGLYGTIGEVEITMKATIEAGMLVIEVVNPVDEDAESQTGTGFGLSSIRRRLLLIYGRNDLLETHRGEFNFTATIKIPQIP